MSELRKSINAILYERITSPFFGTFVVTWILWNWKIFYVTIFESKETLSIARYEFILTNLSSNYWLLIGLPLASTLFLITLFPFATNWLLQVNLWHTKNASDKKKEIEKKQLLTIEDSIALREEIDDQNNKFSKLLKDKENEIRKLNDIVTELSTNSEDLNRELNERLALTENQLKQKEKSLNDFNQQYEAKKSGDNKLKKSIDNLTKERNELNTRITNTMNENGDLKAKLENVQDELNNVNNEISKAPSLFKKITSDETKKENFDRIIQGLNGGDPSLSFLTGREIGFFDSNNILYVDDGSNYYQFTKLGMELQRLFLD